jgi:hypothetical protein
MAENDELTASDLLKKLKKKLRSPVFWMNPNQSKARAGMDICTS